MIDPQSVRAAVTDAGFIVQDFLDEPGWPAPMAVWRPFVLISATPTVRIPHDDADADGRLDREWLRLSKRNGTLGADGTVLLSVEGAGSLPWLKARVGDAPPRASAVGLPGHDCGFVALSLDGRAGTCVSTEEWETWILAERAGPAESETRPTSVE